MRSLVEAIRTGTPNEKHPIFSTQFGRRIMLEVEKSIDF